MAESRSTVNDLTGINEDDLPNHHFAISEKSYSYFSDYDFLPLQSDAMGMAYTI